MDSAARKTLTRIVGVVLVRNEDLFVRAAVLNIIHFCDRIFLVDNGSTDETPALLRDLAGTFPEKLSYHRIDHPRFSHELIREYAGTDTWVFGVDGDEIYDAARLLALRERLQAGEFSPFWMVLGNVLHVTRLESAAGLVSGHLAPPSRSITKLYNFAAITSWDGNTVERLHGGVVCFRPGYEHGSKCNLEADLEWADSPLRCLHLCFLPRSSQDAPDAPVRPNIMELYRGGVRAGVRRFFSRLLGIRSPSRWKEDHYCRGPVVSLSSDAFFPHDSTG